MKDWIKANPKKTIGIVLGLIILGIVAGGGYGG